MHKKIIIFSSLIFMLFITGCISKVKIPVGVKPTKEFTVHSYINDDGVYQASSELILSGLSEEGVVIVCSLYDKKGNLINESYCTTSADGVWTLTLDTPSSGLDNYTLKIKDSNNIYHQTFNDIKFGEVWLYIGDELKNLNYEEKENLKVEENTFDYNLMFFKDNKWIPANEEISEFNYSLANKIYENNKSWNKHPVGVVFATSEEDLIYKWLSHTAISSRKLIMEYLEKENLVYDEDNSLHNMYLSLYKNMSYSNVVLNQGIADLKLFENSNYDENYFRNIYSLQLYTFIGELIHEFNIADNIFILQDSINYNQNIGLLRTIQSDITNYYNVTSIVPTYDLNVFYDIENDLITSDLNEIEGEFTVFGYDYDKLAERINKFNVNNYSATKLDHIVQEYDENKNMITVKLIFEKKLDYSEDQIINGLKFVDSNNEYVELLYSIKDNELIVDLIISEEDDEEINVVDLKYIYYAQDIEIYDNNLFSSNIPVVPFEINLK